MVIFLTWIQKRMQGQTVWGFLRPLARNLFWAAHVAGLNLWQELPPRRAGALSPRCICCGPVRFPQTLCLPGVWPCSSPLVLPVNVPRYGTLFPSGTKTGEGRSFASAKLKRLNVKESS